MLASASSPKRKITAPEMRFTQTSAAGRKRERSNVTPLLNDSHHSADPTKTPRTSTPAASVEPLLATPNPAKIAAKERIVVGFVKVSRNVELYAPARLFAVAFAATVAGLAKNVRAPRYSKKTPPISRSQNCSAISRLESAVSPKAAIAP